MQVYQILKRRSFQLGRVMIRLERNFDIVIRKQATRVRTRKQARDNHYTKYRLLIFVQ